MVITVQVKKKLIIMAITVQAKKDRTIMVIIVSVKMKLTTMVIIVLVKMKLNHLIIMVITVWAIRTLAIIVLAKKLLHQLATTIPTKIHKSFPCPKMILKQLYLLAMKSVLIVNLLQNLTIAFIHQMKTLIHLNNQLQSKSIDNR